MSTGPIAAFWNAAADSFDENADHGLRDPRLRDAWDALLGRWMPAAAPSDVLDLGCGTGSLSLLLARRGHRVVGVDLSPNMVGHAGRKLITAGFDARVLVGNAGAPPFSGHGFDVVLARHLIWTLPDPSAALRGWVDSCRDGGRLVLVEGRWSTATGDDAYAEAAGALPWHGGVRAVTLVETLRPLVSELWVEPLTDPDLWGRPIDDERYAVIATV